MPEINNTDAIRAWLITCPYIAVSKTFGADYLGGDSTEYAVLSVPSTLRYRKNIMGKKVLEDEQSENFIFAAKVPYGKDVTQNLDNISFFKNVSKWIMAQNAAGNFPEWDGGVVTSIECLNTGAPIQTAANNARYQFQIKVTYNVIESE